MAKKNKVETVTEEVIEETKTNITEEVVKNEVEVVEEKVEVPVETKKEEATVQLTETIKDTQAKKQTAPKRNNLGGGFVYRWNS